MVRVVVIACLVGFAIWPLAQTSGVPAFQQDWQWPAVGAQCAGLAHYGTQPWNAAGAGAAQAYPEPWWPYLAESTLCRAAGPHASVLIALALLVAGSALCTATLAGRLFRNEFATVTAVALYCGSVVWMNKVQAGHVLFLASYALQPAVVYAALYLRGRYSWFVAGTLIGIASVQQQFFFFDLFNYALFSWGRPVSRWTLHCLLVALTAAIFTSSEWIIAMVFGGAGSFNALTPLWHYEVSQSAYPIDAARAIGYIGGYDSRELGGGTALLWFVPLLATVGLIANCRERQTWIFACIAFGGFLFISGVLGPAQAIWAYAFDHFAATSIFRELYNGAALFAFGVAFLGAGGVARLAKRWTPAAVLLTTASFAIACWVISHSTSGLPSFSLTAAEERAAATIAAAPGDFRYLSVPTVHPVTQPGVKTAGYSPMTLPLGSHESANSTLGSYPATYAGRLGDLGPLPHELARALGIGSILRMHDMRSGFRLSLEPQLQKLPGIDVGNTNTPTVTMTPGIGLVRIAPVESRAGTLATLNAAPAILDPVHGGSPLDLIALQTSVNPTQSWVRTAYWPALEPWIFAEPPGIFTLRTDAFLDVPAALVVAGSAGGVPFATGCNLLRRLDTHFALFRCGAHPKFAGVSPIAIASATVGGLPAQPSKLSGREGEVRELQVRPWMVTAQVVAARGSAIVLAQSFDPHWTIDVPAKHVVIDGFANGWILSSGVNGRVTIRYGPSTVFFAALYASFACVAVSALLFALRFCSVTAVKSETQG